MRIKTYCSPKCLFVLVFIIMSSRLAAQIKISGTVFDESDKPLPGVSITEKGTRSGVVSDINGQFTTRSLPPNTVLVFASIGFQTSEIIVRDNKPLRVVLKSSQTELNEIVVIGYGEVRRGELTDAVGVVKMKDLQKAPVANFDQALAGRVAGVQVSASEGQPGSELNIVVRGANSLTQSTSPLYVIDGFISEDGISQALNMEDIETINVLKDASATAIYGARGANGVIIIETKKGKLGAPVVNYSGSLGTQNVLNTMEVLSPYEFVKYQLEIDPVNAAARYTANGQTLDSYLGVQGVDWQDKIFNRALMQMHSVSLRGGVNQTRYSVSASLNDQKGVIINSGFKRYQGQVALDQSIGKKVKTGINLIYSNHNQYGIQPSVSEAGGLASGMLMYSTWGYRPVSGNFDDTSLEDDLTDDELGLSDDYRINPYLNAVNTYKKANTSFLNVNAYVNLLLAKDLTLKITGGINNRLLRQDVFNNSKTTRGTPSISSNSLRLTNGSLDYTQSNSWQNENTLTWNKSIGKNHSLKVLGGFTMQQRNLSNYGLSAVKITDENLGMSGLDAGTPNTITAFETVNTLASFLSRVNYDYKNKYLLTASFRADGSSKFSKGNKWGYFPSVGIAWKIKNEEFLKSFDLISDLKFRSSYGETGNNRVSDFPYLSPLNFIEEYYSFKNNDPVMVLAQEQLGSKNLRWETTEQFDVGVDLSLLSNRIQFTADYYQKTTRDLLMNANIPVISGFNEAVLNIGKIQNRGLEFSLNTTNLRTKNFSWESSFNISFNRNKILQLAQNEDFMYSTMAWNTTYNSVPLYKSEIGKPAGQFFGFVFDGVYQVSDFDFNNNQYVLKDGVTYWGTDKNLIKPGDIKFRDLTSDNRITDDDRTLIGNPMPKHVGGFNNNFSYKSLSLNVFFQWSYGNDIYNANRLVFEGNGLARNSLNQFAEFKNRWTPDNASNTLFRAGGQGPTNYYSSRTIEDGSYLRLKTLALAYRLPDPIFRKVGVKNVNLSLSVQNLFTWTNYSGMDPEVAVRNTVLTPGFDYSAYPHSRTIVFGLKTTL